MACWWGRRGEASAAATRRGGAVRRPRRRGRRARNRGARVARLRPERPAAVPSRGFRSPGADFPLRVVGQAGRPGRAGRLRIGIPCSGSKDHRNGGKSRALAAGYAFWAQAQTPRPGQGFRDLAAREAGGAKGGLERLRGEPAVEPADGSPQCDREQESRIGADRQDVAYAHGLIVRLHHDEPASGPEDAQALVEDGAPVGDQVENAVAGDRVDAASPERQPGRVGLDPRQAPRPVWRRRRMSPGAPEHAPGDVDAGHRVLRPKSRQLQSGRASPAAQVDHPQGSASCGEAFGQAAAALLPGALRRHPSVEIGGGLEQPARHGAVTADGLARDRALGLSRCASRGGRHGPLGGVAAPRRPGFTSFAFFALEGVHATFRGATAKPGDGAARPSRRALLTRGPRSGFPRRCRRTEAGVRPAELRLLAVLDRPALLGQVPRGVDIGPGSTASCHPPPPPPRASSARRVTASTRSRGSTGFARCTWKPAARACARSSRRA